MKPQEGWLKCQVSEGMFPEEYAVQCDSENGDIFSFFAPSEYIDIKQNLVKINIMQSKNNVCLIYVPFVPLEGGVSRTVKVPLKNVISPR